MSEPEVLSEEIRRRNARSTEDVDRAVGRTTAEEVDRSLTEGSRRFRRRRGTGLVPNDFDANRRLEVQRIAAREAVLSDLTQVFQSEISNSQRHSSALTRHRANLQSLGERFLSEIDAFEAGPGGNTEQLTGPGRRRILQVFDTAYGHSHADWGSVRVSYMKQFYASPEGLEIVNRLRTARGSLPATIRISDDEMRAGHMFQIWDGISTRSPNYMEIDVEHALSRGRQPFAAFEHSNLHFKTARENQVPLNQIAARSVFPGSRTYIDAGDYDRIEEFVQRHQLSRRQRLPTDSLPSRRTLTEQIRRNRTRTGQGISVFFLILAVSNAAEAASEGREALSRIRAREQRDRTTPRFRLQDFSIYDLANDLDSILGVHPLELVRHQALGVARATQYWARDLYDIDDGERARWWDSELRRISDQSDRDAAVEHLMTVGLRSGQNIGIESIMGLSHQDTIMGNILISLSTVRSLSSVAERYREIADAARSYSTMRRNELVVEVGALTVAGAAAIAGDIHDNASQIASQYSTYLRAVRDVNIALRNALIGNQNRSDELVGIINEIDRDR